MLAIDPCRQLQLRFEKQKMSMELERSELCHSSLKGHYLLEFKVTLLHRDDPNKNIEKGEQALRTSPLQYVQIRCHARLLACIAANPHNANSLCLSALTAAELAAPKDRQM